jgi:hypothetical protein
VLAATVNVALSQDQSTRGYSHLDVQASAGVVQVTTRAATPAVEAVARSVPGVRDVRVTEIPVVPLPL